MQRQALAVDYRHRETLRRFTSLTDPANEELIQQLNAIAELEDELAALWRNRS